MRFLSSQARWLRLPALLTTCAAGALVFVGVLRAADPPPGANEAASAVQSAQVPAGQAPAVQARPALLIDRARARPTPPGATVAAVYLRIHNAGTAEDRLLRLSTPVADRVQVHETQHEQSMVRMREVAFVDVPANASVEATPGGLHIMLLGLTRPLQNGDRFPLTLVFAHSGTLVANVSVRTDP